MSHDTDPESILARLPEHERDFFLTQYRERAHAAADDVTAYKALQRFLHLWSIRAHTPREDRDPAAEAQAILNGAPTIPIEEALAETLGMTRDEAAAWSRQKVEQATERTRRG
jgi:hypothetical protein